MNNNILMTLLITPYVNGIGFILAIKGTKTNLVHALLPRFTTASQNFLISCSDATHSAKPSLNLLRCCKEVLKLSSFWVRCVKHFCAILYFTKISLVSLHVYDFKLNAIDILKFKFLPQV